MVPLFYLGDREASEIPGKMREDLTVKANFTPKHTNLARYADTRPLLPKKKAPLLPQNNCELRKHQFLLTLFYGLAFFLLSIPNKNLVKMYVRVVEY